MIGLSRGPEPEVLRENGARWAQEYLDHVGGVLGLPAAAKDRWRHPEIKTALQRDTFGKCAYCESKPQAVSPGDVEHVYPKSLYPDRALTWDNLTYACSRCNNSKRNHDQGTTPVVDPFTDEPSEHLIFAGPVVADRTLKGQLTVGVLELNRPELILQRSERIQAVNRLIAQWRLLPEGPDRDMLWSIIERETAHELEYTAATAAFIEFIVSSENSLG